MSELIDRQAAIDALKHNQDVYSHNFHDDPIDKYTTAIIATDIDTLVNLPPAQPELHEGYWIEGKIYRDVIECNCSECGQLMTTAATVRMNYCPNCGAKMTISTK